MEKSRLSTFVKHGLPKPIGAGESHIGYLQRSEKRMRQKDKEREGRIQQAGTPEGYKPGIESK